MIRTDLSVNVMKLPVGRLQFSLTNSNCFIYLLVRGCYRSHDYGPIAGWAVVKVNKDKFSEVIYTMAQT